MSEIEGYKVVPLRLTKDAVNCHSIFMREHFIRLMDPNKPKGRTLFLLNIPPYVTEDSLRTFFNHIGAVTLVLFAEKPGRDETDKWYHNCRPFSNGRAPFKFKVAYIVFKSSTSISRALELQSIDLFSLGTGESLIKSGIELLHNECEKRILKKEETQDIIDKFMAEYDEQEKQAQEAARTSEADADGWVTVGKQGPNAGFEQKETVIDRLEEKLVVSKKKKELTNFYTFQIRESKMKNIIELRQKFEDDKRKIEALKKMRRFKPF